MARTYLEDTNEFLCIQEADCLQKTGEGLDPYRSHDTGGIDVDQDWNHEMEEPPNNCRLRAQEVCTIHYRFFGCDRRNNALLAILYRLRIRRARVMRVGFFRWSLAWRRGSWGRCSWWILADEGSGHCIQRLPRSGTFCLCSSLDEPGKGFLSVSLVVEDAIYIVESILGTQDSALGTYP